MESPTLGRNLSHFRRDEAFRGCLQYRTSVLAGREGRPLKRKGLPKWQPGKLYSQTPIFQIKENAIQSIIRFRIPLKVEPNPKTGLIFDCSCNLTNKQIHAVDSATLLKEEPLIWLCGYFVPVFDRAATGGAAISRTKHRFTPEVNSNPLVYAPRDQGKLGEVLLSW